MIPEKLRKTFHLGLDVHKAETVIAILESDRDVEPRHYGFIATTLHVPNEPCDFSSA